MSNVSTGRGAPKFKPSQHGRSAPVDGCSAVGIWPVVPRATVVEVPWADVTEAPMRSDFASMDEVLDYSLVAN